MEASCGRGWGTPRLAGGPAWPPGLHLLALPTAVGFSALDTKRGLRGLEEGRHGVTREWQRAVLFWGVIAPPCLEHLGTVLQVRTLDEPPATWNCLDEHGQQMSPPSS